MIEAHKRGMTGKGVKIVILDSGIDASIYAVKVLDASGEGK